MSKRKTERGGGGDQRANGQRHLVHHSVVADLPRTHSTGTGAHPMQFKDASGEEMAE